MILQVQKYQLSARKSVGFEIEIPLQLDGCTPVGNFKERPPMFPTSDQEGSVKGNL